MELNFDIKKFITNNMANLTPHPETKSSKLPPSINGKHRRILKSIQLVHPTITEKQVLDWKDFLESAARHVDSNLIEKLEVLVRIR